MAFLPPPSDAVLAERKRIQESLAAGTYGEGQLGKQREDVAASYPQFGIPQDEDYQRRFGDSFFHQPSMWEQNLNPAQLRQQLNLENLQTLTAQRRLALQQEEEQAPLKTRLLQAKIAASGAHEKFLQTRDAATLEHMGGFLNYLNDEHAPTPSDPNYNAFIIQGLRKFPLFANSPGGRDMLKAVAGTQATHMSIDELQKQLPPGMELKTVEIGGGKQSHITAEPTGTKAARELKQVYGLTRAHLERPGAVSVGMPGEGNTFKANNLGTHVRIAKPDGTDVIMTTQEYEKLGGKYSPETLKARKPVQDKIGLANKALKDPNATAEEKAGALKFLNENSTGPIDEGDTGEEDTDQE